MLLVSEIFYSIQGESTYAGLPCVFVRLARCNLRCRYCDTRYAYSDGHDMSVDRIAEVVKQFGCPLVEITGGEPLLQPDVHPLMTGLLSDGYEVLLETNGSLDVSPVDLRVVKIVDVKCPDSGMVEHNLYGNLSSITPRDQVKFVISSLSDYQWAAQVVKERALTEKATVLFSPAYGYVEPSDLSGWLLHERLPVRLHLQLHKYIWGLERRGS